MENVYIMEPNLKTPGIAILISDKTDFKRKCIITKDNEWYFIVVKFIMKM